MRLGAFGESSREAKPSVLRLSAAAAPEPHAIQRQALAALDQTRADGFTAGMVVLATGSGKTWLSAFDSRPFGRVLFVAHREEIQTQALETFRACRPGARLGRYAGAEKDLEADVLFASVQTLGRVRHCGSSRPTHSTTSSSTSSTMPPRAPIAP